MSIIDAIRENPDALHSARRFMSRYSGGTPYQAWLIFRHGRMAAMRVSLSSEEWGEVNDFMWSLKVEQQPLFEDMAQQINISFDWGR